MDNQTLIISHTDTEGYRRSLIDSPSWNPVFRVTESLIKKFNIKIMAEIGVARGHHSAHLLEAAPGLRVYSIDPWGYFADEYDNMYNYHTLADDEKIYQKVAELLKPFGARSIILRCTSKRAVPLIKEPLDMVYLDGDHSYEGIKEDIENYWDKLKTGGILSGNAYGHTIHPGVAEAVNEFVKNERLKLHLEIGKAWWLVKPETIENKISAGKGAKNFQIRPPFSQRLKRKIKRSLIIAPVKARTAIKNIPGAMPVYQSLKKLWK